jgi:hypothetical protein
MTVRPIRPDDRARALALLGDARAIDSPGSHVQVVEEDGRVVGAGVGIAPRGSEGILGAIITEDPRRMDLFHQLLTALVERAIEHGYQFGRATVRRRSLVRRVEQAYGLTAEPFGRDPRTREPTSWTFRVDLPTFLEQLRSMG